MIVIDVHNHYLPDRYLEAIRRGPSNIRFAEDEHGNPVLRSPGDYNVVVRGHRDPEVRLAALAAAGVDRQLLSFTAPGTSVETPARAVALARLVNDALVEVVAAYPDRFRALATLPLSTPAAAVEELERATEAGLSGAMLFSNAGGVPLADARFEALYAYADRHGLLLMIHPTYPLGVEALREFMLMPLVGFPADTTLAAAHLVFAGIPERYSRIRWILAHLGGTIPYVAERLDRGFEAFPACRRQISRPPSEYLRRFYYDTVNFDPACLRLALRFAGPGRLLAGSDYPHMIGSLERMLASLRSLDLTADQQEAILGGNAAGLLGWPPAGELLAGA